MHYSTYRYIIHNYTQGHSNSIVLFPIQYSVIHRPLLFASISVIMVNKKMFALSFAAQDVRIGPTQNKDNKGQQKNMNGLNIIKSKVIQEHCLFCSLDNVL